MVLAETLIQGFACVQNKLQRMRAFVAFQLMPVFVGHFWTYATLGTQGMKLGVFGIYFGVKAAFYCFLLFSINFDFDYRCLNNHNDSFRLKISLIVLT